MAEKEKLKIEETLNVTYEIKIPAGEMFKEIGSYKISVGELIKEIGSYSVRTALETVLKQLEEEK